MIKSESRFVFSNAGDSAITPEHSVAKPTRRSLMNMMVSAAALTAASTKLSYAEPYVDERSSLSNSPAYGGSVTAAEAVFPELYEFCADLAKASQERTIAGHVFNQAFRHMKAWERANPSPRGVDDEGRNVPNINALMNAWQADRIAELRLCEKVKKHHAYESAHSAFKKAAESVSFFDAKNMAEILLKAQASYDHDTDDRMIANSIVVDLLNMNGETAGDI